MPWGNANQGCKICTEARRVSTQQNYSGGEGCVWVVRRGEWGGGEGSGGMHCVFFIVTVNLRQCQCWMRRRGWADWTLLYVCVCAGGVGGILASGGKGKRFPMYRKEERIKEVPWIFPPRPPGALGACSTSRKVVILVLCLNVEHKEVEHAEGSGNISCLHSISFCEGNNIWMHCNFTF